MTASPRFNTPNNPASLLNPVPSPGVVGQSYTSDVALDDVGFRNCGENELPVCNFAEFTCGNGRCIPLDQVCDLVDHCWDGTDENDCGE